MLFALLPTASHKNIASNLKIAQLVRFNKIVLPINEEESYLPAFTNSRCITKKEAGASGVGQDVLVTLAGEENAVQLQVTQQPAAHQSRWKRILQRVPRFRRIK